MTSNQRDFAWKHYDRELSIPSHKIRYLLVGSGETGQQVLIGCFKGIKNSGLELTDELFNIFVDVLQYNLADNPDIEYEFSSREWTSIQKIRTSMIENNSIKL